MGWPNWNVWDAALMGSAFLVGTMLVHRLQRRGAGSSTGAVAKGTASAGPAARPAAQIPVRGIDQLVDVTHTAALMRSIEQRMRFSAAQFDRDCRPVLEAFAEFVQMLPASECHHHAQPGGLWIHALEVVDAALTLRAGIELPAGASTEDRKRQEHRWTYALFAAALLHDVGKPVTDLQVTLYSQDPRFGRPWVPLSGAMAANGAHFYSVAFTTPSERDYQAHQKLAAMLLHQFVPPRLMRWLAEEGQALTQLLAYLAGEAPQEPIAEIVKRADSDSVRRNLLHGPRTRFASARTRPLIERLMEALRRMLAEGAVLPLNRPGAAGWVHDGCVWFVCARLADEVRNYLAQHESAQGVPGKDRNDRMFDTWQESGVARPAPDGGAIWRVRVECESWKSPDALTVLCMPLEKVYAEQGQYPAPVKGRVIVEAASSATPTAAVTVAAPAAAATTPAPAPSSPAPVPAATPVSVALVKPSSSPSAAVPVRPASKPATAPGLAPAPAAPVAPAHGKPAQAPDAALSQQGSTVPAPRPQDVGSSTAAPAVSALSNTAPASPAREIPAPVAGDSTQLTRPDSTDSDVLSADESARLVEPATQVHALPASASAGFKVGPPMRPHQGDQPRPKKGPTPAAEALMAWVAHAVGSGELKYNEDGALVHFVPEGCLILSPEIFRRFVELHRAIPDSPVAELVTAHGDGAFKRLQNELAKSGWTARAGDENMHPYAFVKADGSLSRPASFFLLSKPELFWNPVPGPNARIRKVARPKKLAVSAAARP